MLTDSVPAVRTGSPADVQSSGLGGLPTFGHHFAAETLLNDNPSKCKSPQNTDGWTLTIRKIITDLYGCITAAAAVEHRLKLLQKPRSLTDTVSVTLPETLKM